MSEFMHKPVLLDETLSLLDLEAGKVVVDGTLGLGGHAQHILQKIKPNGILVGIDKDRQALSMTKQRLTEGLLPVQGSFHDIKDILQKQGIDKVDAVLFDLGVSSMQLDDPERGFSYQHDGPLDMRMDTQQGLSAADIVNTWTAEELERMIRQNAEERWAKRIAQFIVERRADKSFETTYELVDAIKAAIPAGARKDGPHPAKRTFQAIRIEVNEELSRLPQAIEDAVDVLNPGGRLCIITFHSLEDRIVKQAFKRLESDCECPPGTPVCICDKQQQVKIITRHAVKPSEAEVEDNPRARSALLRAAERVTF